jgi:hypothetical protein
MIRTARILLAGILHVLAAHVDVQDTYIIVRLDDEPDPAEEAYLLHADAIVRAMNAQTIAAQARMN